LEAADVVPIRELAETWSSWYSNSAVIRSSIAFAHVGGLVAGGGSAIAADRATLRALARGGPFLAAEIDRLQGAHRIVLAGLVAVGLSGVLLMLANFDEYLVSKVFWLKMTLVAISAVVAVVFQRAVRRHERQWDDTLVHRPAIRGLAVGTFLIWMAIIVLGRLIAYDHVWGSWSPSVGQ